MCDLFSTSGPGQDMDNYCHWPDSPMLHLCHWKGIPVHLREDLVQKPRARCFVYRWHDHVSTIARFEEGETWRAVQRKDIRKQKIKKACYSPRFVNRESLSLSLFLSLSLSLSLCICVYIYILYKMTVRASWWGRVHPDISSAKHYHPDSGPPARMSTEESPSLNFARFRNLLHGDHRPKQFV